jgi:hypothetical protein
MSNTWDYRFAFHVETPKDVPGEFRSAYDRLLDTRSIPIFSLFSPAMNDPVFIFSRWLPPRLILMFSESLVVLSLDTRSDQVQEFDCSRQDLLAYGWAEFLLTCWFSFYPGPSGEERLQIRFPSRASQKFEGLAWLLLDWLEGEGEVATPVFSLANAAPSLRTWQAPKGSPTPQLSSTIPGLPKKVSSFLEAHPEFGPASDFFFQPAMDHRGKGQKRWPNLLLATASKGIVVLTDERQGATSEYGLEMTYLPLRRVCLVDWMEPSGGRAASIRVCLKGRKVEMVLSWPVFGGLKSYALRWSRGIESMVNTLASQHDCPPSWSERR